MTESNIYLCQLPQEVKEYAALILNENDSDRSQKIEEIRRWIAETDNLYARTDDFFLLRFLRACKFNVSKTTTKLWNYYMQRSTTPEWFANRDPFLTDTQELLNSGIFLPFKRLDDNGRLVILIRIAAHNPHKYKLDDLIKANLMILDVATREHESVSLYGTVVIIDLNAVTLSHALQLTPSVIKKLVHAWQGCYPIRIQSMEFINVPIYINVILNIFKSFMNSKLKSKVHVRTSDITTLSDTINTDILPTDYGGNEDSIQDLKVYWKTVVEDNRRWLIDDEQYKVILPE